MAHVDFFGGDRVSAKGFYEFCTRNIPLMVSVAAVLIFIYGIKLGSDSIGIDTEWFIVDKAYSLGWNARIGRWGLGFLQRLWYIWEFNPVATFFVTVSMIWLFAMSWCYMVAVFTKKVTTNNRLIPFALVFVTSSVWVEQFYFVPQSAETAAMIALCPFVIYLFFDGALSGRIGKQAAAIVLLVLMLSVYQAIAPLFIAGVLVFFILLQNNSAYEARAYNALGLKLISGIMLALIAWKLIGNLILHFLGLERSDYVDNMSKWGSEPPRDIVMNILLFGYRITIGHVPAMQSLLEPVIAEYAIGGIDTVRSASRGARAIGNVFLLPVAILFVVQIVRLAVARVPAGRRVLYVLAGLGIPLSIMLLPVVIGGRPPLRAMDALPFSAAFMFYSLFNIPNKVVSKFFGVIALYVSLHQAQISAQLLYSDHVRYRYDINLAYELNRLIEPLQYSANSGAESRDLPVAIVGARYSSSVFLREGGRTNFMQGEVLGHSFFEWDSGEFTEGGTRGLTFMKTLGFNYTWATEEQMAVARDIAQDMPSYPAPGSVQALPDMIIVKLSESQYRPPN